MTITNITTSVFSPCLNIETDDGINIRHEECVGVQNYSTENKTVYSVCSCTCHYKLEKEIFIINLVEHALDKGWLNFKPVKHFFTVLKDNVITITDSKTNEEYTLTVNKIK